MIELLVGIMLGLLVIGAAIGTLAISRQTSGTVSDVSQLQQQASYALRAIGLQLRQAGSLELVPKAAGGPFTFLEFSDPAVEGTDGAAGASDTLLVGNQPSSLATLQRDCLGATIAAGTLNNPSTFAVNTNRELTCLGLPGNPVQPVIGNVADFQVSYRVNTGTTPAPVFQLFTPTQMIGTPARWQRVVAIEVCLDLQGIEPVPDLGATYQNCQAASAARNGRVHFVSRNVFHVRKQNVLEFPLP